MQNYVKEKDAMDVLNETLGKDFKFKYHIIHDKPVNLDIVIRHITTKNRHIVIDNPKLNTALGGDKVFVLAKVRIKDLKQGKYKASRENSRKIVDFNQEPALLVNRSGEVLVGVELLKELKKNKGMTEVNCWIPSDKKFVSGGAFGMGTFDMAF